MCIFALVTAIQAEHFGGFLENIYDELQTLNLSKEQESALKNVIKNHHNFLRQWYLDARTNSEKIMQNFATSSLQKSAPEFAHDKQLNIERINAEHGFMMSVYEILDSKQREIFGTKLKNAK